MAATGLQANWSTVQFDATAVRKVTSVSFDKGGQLVEFAGDVDKFPSLLVKLFSPGPGRERRGPTAQSRIRDTTYHHPEDAIHPSSPQSAGAV